MTYNADFFIEGFTDIPDEFWCVNWFKTNDGKSCALGHLGATNYSYGDLANRFDYFIKEALGYSVIDINDGKVYAYPQPTPKTRILAALYDAKNKGL